MLRFWFLLILNAPILAEVIRKYLIPNDLVFLGADVAAAVTLGIICANKKLRPPPLPLMFYVFSGAFIFCTLALQMFVESNFGIYSIGFRANYMPIVYLLLSASFFKTQPNAAKYLFASATFWIIVAALMAAAQIALGKDHPINNVWGLQGGGIGDYVSAKGEHIDRSLFRPTSIFMHTGKFGQVAFILVLFRLCYTLYNGRKTNKLLLPLFGFDLVALFISGQRGAFLFISISLVILILLSAKSGRKTALQMTSFAAVFSVVVGSLITMFPQYGTAFYERFYSAIEALPRRLQGNLIDPFATIFSEFLVTGRGFGYYTFGSRAFGGTVVYNDRHLALSGFGESTIVRMCLETGFLFTLINIAVFIVIYVKALAARRGFGRSLPGSSIIFYLLWIGSLILWSNTADVFGNTIPMFYGYALSGAILLNRRNLNHSKKIPLSAKPTVWPK